MKSVITATRRFQVRQLVLVERIETLDTIEPTGPIEQAMTWLLLQAYRRRLRAIVASAPAEVPPYRAG
ncbi:MAG: hypothetical protein U9R72_11305 [Chloroflexota bacterium]|nr:hypothetical protein [Chloroflexota bacterium]